MPLTGLLFFFLTGKSKSSNISTADTSGAESFSTSVGAESVSTDGSETSGAAWLVPGASGAWREEEEGGGKLKILI